MSWSSDGCSSDLGRRRRRLRADRRPRGASHRLQREARRAGARRPGVRAHPLRQPPGHLPAGRGSAAGRGLPDDHRRRDGDRRPAVRRDCSPGRGTVGRKDAMARFRRRRVTAMSINRMIPNALTLLALCSGLTALRFALQERWELAVGAVLVAMLFDGLDGRIARLMGATSELGAQLDSLSDVIAFGVAPAVMVYLWTLSDAGGVGWAACLVYAACCALRLARFNTALGDENPEIGRASCRERVCQYVWISVGAGSLKKK